MVLTWQAVMVVVVGCSVLSARHRGYDKFLIR